MAKYIFATFQTIRDASQLLRLSRRFSKKPKPLKKRGQGGPVFGLSLQQQHFRALRHRQQQQQQQNGGELVESI